VPKKKKILQEKKEALTLTGKKAKIYKIVNKKLKGRSKKRALKVVKMGVLEQINLNAGGIDVGSGSMFVAIPEDRCDIAVREFKSFTADLHELLNWLKMYQIDTVAMESTGVYWMPLYEILDNAGIEVYLVDAGKVKNVTGRKTDVQDAQWLQQLHTYGLLSQAFVPDGETRKLRDLIRHRDNLLRYRASHIQHMQKALEQMNLKLTNVLSDITGTTGMQIIRAIVSGERSPRELAKYRDCRCRKSEEEIAKSLEGYYKEELIYVLSDYLHLYDVYTERMKKLEEQVEQLYKKFSKRVDDKNEKPLKELSRSKACHASNAPDYDLRAYLYKIAGVDLVQVDGFNVLTIQDIISEVGVIMSRWPTIKNFTSWLTSSPNNKISGGKVLYRFTKKSKSRAYKAFRLAATGVARSDNPIGRFYRRIKAKYGAPIAVTATANKLARIFYVMLSKQVEYSRELLEQLEEKNKEKVIRNLKKRVEKLGYELVPKGA
jgi:transposase